MTDFLRKSRLVISLSRRWLLALARGSYWHVPQGLGRRFVPGELAGYFNDLTLKVDWRGPVDQQGLPINEFRGRQFYFATTLFQKALGHWDCWLISNEEKHRLEFLKIAQWAVENQNGVGGWPLWSVLGLSYPSDYSAMTQGEGTSMLVRAYKITHDITFLRAARRALEPVKRPVSEGGTCRVVPEGIVLEEFPDEKYRAVLNGWIFALFGLYDYLLVEGDSEVFHLLSKTLDALEAYLPSYNAGYWSFYDLSGHLASPFYHMLHIAQLQALSLAFPDRTAAFRALEAEFRRQLRSPVGRARALFVKIVQKLHRPPEVVLE